MLVRRDDVASWANALNVSQRHRLDELHELGHRVLEATGEFERNRSWHELLFAVGNMKRSAGNMHPPGTWLTDAPDRNERGAEVLLPYGREDDTMGSSVLFRDDAESWHVLRRGVRGLGAATTSMVLASLWPEHHATFDRLTRLVVGALRWPDEMTAPGEHPPPIALTSYRDWYRPHMLQFAQELETSLSTVERGFFSFAQRTMSGRRPLIRWNDEAGWDGMRKQVREQIRRGPTRATSGEDTT